MHYMNGLLKNFDLQKIRSVIMHVYYLKNVESASVATAFAKYDFPVPGGPYNKNALHGFLLPERPTNIQTSTIFATENAETTE